jgi:hypothetical protein
VHERYDRDAAKRDRGGSGEERPCRTAAGGAQLHIHVVVANARRTRAARRSPELLQVMRRKVKDSRVQRSACGSPLPFVDLFFRSVVM